MAFCGIKIGNATLTERNNWIWFHKFSFGVGTIRLGDYT